MQQMNSCMSWTRTRELLFLCLMVKVVDCAFRKKERAFNTVFFLFLTSEHAVVKRGVAGIFLFWHT